MGSARRMIGLFIVLLVLLAPAAFAIDPDDLMAEARGTLSGATSSSSAVPGQTSPLPTYSGGYWMDNDPASAGHGSLEYFDELPQIDYVPAYAGAPSAQVVPSLLAVGQSIAEWAVKNDAVYAPVDGIPAWMVQSIDEGEGVTSTRKVNDGRTIVFDYSANDPDLSNDDTYTYHEYGADGRIQMITTRVLDDGAPDTLRYYIPAPGEDMVIDGLTDTGVVAVDRDGVWVHANTGEPYEDQEFLDALCDGKPGCRDQVDNNVIRRSDGDLNRILSAMSFGQVLGTLVKGYQEFQGILYFTSLLNYMSRPEVERRKQELAESFCLIGGVGRCITSTVCNLYSDYEPGSSAVVTNDVHGAPVIGGNINGYKVGPIQIKGADRDDLLLWFGNTTWLPGEGWVDLTDPAFDSNDLPEMEMFFYLVQYTANNPDVSQTPGTYLERQWFDRVRNEQDRSYNVLFEGDRSAYWFADDFVLKPGNHRGEILKKYSTTDYDEVCLTYNPPFDMQVSDDDITFTGWSGGGWGTISGRDKVCSPLVSYDGPPTAIDDDPDDGDDAGGQPPAAPGVRV